MRSSGRGLFPNLGLSVTLLPSLCPRARTWGHEPQPPSSSHVNKPLPQTQEVTKGMWRGNSRTLHTWPLAPPFPGPPTQTPHSVRSKHPTSRSLGLPVLTAKASTLDTARGWHWLVCLPAETGSHRTKLPCHLPSPWPLFPYVPPPFKN